MVFTQLPLITGDGRVHDCEVPLTSQQLVEAGKLKPLLNGHVIPMVDIDTAYELAEFGAVGKVVVEFGS